MSTSPPDRAVSLREANQGFARYVREVEGGVGLIITRNGRPVARLAPIGGTVRQLSSEQEAARLRTRARMKNGWRLALGPLDRDELHER